MKSCKNFKIGYYFLNKYLEIILTFYSECVLNSMIIRHLKLNGSYK